MKTRTKYRIFSLIFFISIITNAQTYTERYDFTFSKASKYGPWEWQYITENCKFSHDTASATNNEIPLKISYGARPFANENTNPNMIFELGRVVLLPRNSTDSFLVVSIGSKSENAQPVNIQVRSIDREGTTIDATQATVQNRLWTENRLKVAVKYADAVEITITYSGNSSKTQAIWLKGIKLAVNDKHLLQKYKENNELNASFELEKTITPIVSNNDVWRTLPSALKNKKIIGIGAFSPNSLSANDISTAICESFVNAGGKIVALDISPDKGFILDLYVNAGNNERANYLRKVTDNIIKDENVDTENFWRFLRLMKLYNDDTTDKIHVVGISACQNINYFLPDIFTVLAGEENSKKYMKLFFDIQHQFYPNYIKIEDVLNNDNWLRKTIDKRSLVWLKTFIRSTQTNANRKITEEINWKNQHKDSLMYQKVKQLTDIYLKPSEKMLILAHSRHVGRQKGIEPFCNEKSMGYFLDKTFGELYGNISIQAVGGECTVEEGTPGHSKMIADTLSNPTPGSFEYYCKPSKSQLFYCSAKAIPQYVNELRSVGRSKKFADQFVLIDVQRAFDGYLVVNNSLPLAHYNELFNYRPNLQKTQNNFERYSKNREKQSVGTPQSSQRTVIDILNGKTPAR